MRYTKTPLHGAYVVELERVQDSRGFFAYLFESREAQEMGLDVNVAQVKLSYNVRKGTLRGLHLQLSPAAESKFVRCIRGAVHDAIIDLRPDSETYLQHFAVELSGDNRKALYVPKMFAHGYQTLTDDAEVMYQVDAFYSPTNEKGVRHDDPALGIKWPLPVSDISPKDAAWELLSERMDELRIVTARQ